MNAKNTKGRTKDTLKGKTDWKRIDALTDGEIERAVASDPDSELLEDFNWEQVRVVLPPKKRAVYIKLDEDVIAYFKSDGRGYQARINAVLRSYMEANKD